MQAISNHGLITQPAIYQVIETTIVEVLFTFSNSSAGHFGTLQTDSAARAVAQAAGASWCKRRTAQRACAMVKTATVVITVVGP